MHPTSVVQSTAIASTTGRPRPGLARPIFRVGSIRHLALVVASLAACCLQRSWSIGPGVLFVLASAAVANVAIAQISQRFAGSPFARVASPAVGIVAWAAVVGWTGGVRSPLVAGFWLEIALSPLLLPPSQILVLVTATVVALWTQQLFFGIRTALEPLGFETAFLVVTGGLTWWAAERFARRERTLTAQVRDLERQFEGARTVAGVGERAASVAHAAKSAVHSLRGFTDLIEEPLLKDPAHREALEGLRLAIHRLDEIARLALRPAGRGGGRASRGSSAAEISRTVEDVVRSVRPLHHEIRLVAHQGDGLKGVDLPAAHLREVLLALLENAVEATGGRGPISLEVKVHEGMLRLQVRDRGAGLDSALAGRLFQPGATTKADGTGFGLFVARRLVESGGGRLTADSPTDGGTVFEVSLPVREGEEDAPGWVP